MDLTLTRVAPLLWRALRLRCPNCGAGAELLFAAIFVGVLLVTLPDVPWTRLQYGRPALMIVFPIFFYPFSKTIFLACHLIFRPPTPEDFS